MMLQDGSSKITPEKYRKNPKLEIRLMKSENLNDQNKSGP